MNLWLLTIALLAPIFFSAMLLMASILFPGDMNIFQSVIRTYMEMPGPVGTLIRITWPFFPFIGIWALTRAE